MDPRILRAQTRAEHEATESSMPLMIPELSLRTYLQVLRVLFPLLKSWEVWADGAAKGELRSMLERRRRSDLLMADLSMFGEKLVGQDKNVIDWDAVVMGHTDRKAVELDPASFHANLLGAVYVMEGSTLGGRFLARHVENILGFQPGIGDSYFQGHGEATGSLWREVIDKISAVSEQHAPLTIASAKRTFGAFGGALRSGLCVHEEAHG